MASVFLVTAGDYSDYHVCGVFSARRLAKQFSELIPGCRIEKFPLDAMPDFLPGHKRYVVTY